MKYPIFLKPIFKERIWGGTALRDQFNYNIPSDTTGECWAISAHPNGSSVVESGKFNGKLLSELWDKHPELFGYYKSEHFPLLVKILDANENLSIQVHPNDAFAKANEKDECGKTECWYIIDCDEEAEIVLGHNANTKEQFVSMIKNGHWDKLLQRIKIKPGDFFYIPSGTLHALCKGALVLEIQQSADTTYRIYDYNRRDKEGNLRELHIEKAIKVTTIPHMEKRREPALCNTNKSMITTFVEGEYFTVYKWDIFSRLEMIQDCHFMLMSVIDGNGTLCIQNVKYPIQKGQHFILPNGTGNFVIEGAVQLIVSHP
ncbi:mannose-6-phosphate isomerase, class I [Niallia oryzisoli]|uniref:Mannose-6-phosphate isomerase n=1 Tax=Niallia oryzisoli TaxID=1737571 RepID=A0ABZ2C5V5_9BACI